MTQSNHQRTCDGRQYGGGRLYSTVLYCTVLTCVRSLLYSRIMASSSRSLAHTMRWPAASSRRASCCRLRSAIQATTFRTRRSVLASSRSMSVLRYFTTFLLVSKSQLAGVWRWVHRELEQLCTMNLGVSRQIFTLEGGALQIVENDGLV